MMLLRKRIIKPEPEIIRLTLNRKAKNEATATLVEEVLTESQINLIAESSDPGISIRSAITVLLRAESTLGEPVDPLSAAYWKVRETRLPEGRWEIYKDIPHPGHVILVYKSDNRDTCYEKEKDAWQQADWMNISCDTHYTGDKRGPYPYGTGHGNPGHIDIPAIEDCHDPARHRCCDPVPCECYYSKGGC